MTVTVEPGDRIKLKGNSYNGRPIGDGALGTIAVIVDDFHIGVVFDEKFKGGHGLSGAGPNYPLYEDGHCRWGREEEFEVIGKVEPPMPRAYSKYPGQTPSFVGEQFPTAMRRVEEAVDD